LKAAGPSKAAIKREKEERLRAHLLKTESPASKAIREKAEHVCAKRLLHKAALKKRDLAYEACTLKGKVAFLENEFEEFLEYRRACRIGFARVFPPGTAIPDVSIHDFQARESDLGPYIKKNNAKVARLRLEAANKKEAEDKLLAQKSNKKVAATSATKEDQQPSGPPAEARRFSLRCD